MSGPRDALDAIGQLPDVEIDLAGAALQFARIDDPRRGLALGAGPSVGAGAGCRGRWRGSCQGRHWRPAPAALAGLITGRHGYAGDTETYDDPANANMIQVTERRRGLPVALGILWLHCARAAGWAAHGLDFPGHFLIALQSALPRGKGRATEPQSIVLDVFAGGVPLGARDLRGLLKRVEGRDAELRPGVLQPMPARGVLLRLQNNIRTRRQDAGDLTGALTCLEDMLRIAPDAAVLWRTPR